MSVMTSLMYAAASVALLALVLECCCRRRLKRLRDSPHVLALNVVNSGPYPVATPYPGAGDARAGAGCALPLSAGAGADAGVLYNATPAPAPAAPYPLPAASIAVGPTYYVHAFPIYASTNAQHVETPPPSYEQVMAGDRARTQPQPG